MKLAYFGVFETAEDGVSVTFPDVPGAKASGLDLEDAREQAGEALLLALCHLASRNEDFPTPAATGLPEDLVRIGVLEHSKLLLHRETRYMSQANLGDLMGAPKGSAQTIGKRMLDFNHKSHIGSIEEALAKLKCRISLDAE